MILAIGFLRSIETLLTFPGDRITEKGCHRVQRRSHLAAETRIPHIAFTPGSLPSMTLAMGFLRLLETLFTLPGVRMTQQRFHRVQRMPYLVVEPKNPQLTVAPGLRATPGDSWQHSISLAMGFIRSI